MVLLMQLALRTNSSLLPHFLKSVCVLCADFHSSSRDNAEYVRMRRVQRVQKLGAKPSEKWKPLRGRKPLFVPPAKTKFFNVPQLPVFPPDEMALLRSWAISYEASLDGLYTLFRFDEQTNEARRASSIREDNPLSSADLRDAISEFNRESQRLRTAALPKWLLVAKQDATEKQKQYEETDFRELVRIEKRLHTDLAEVDHFIDASNVQTTDLDALVRSVIDAPPVSFEFAIDERGERVNQQRAVSASVASQSESNAGQDSTTPVVTPAPATTQPITEGEDNKAR